MTLEITREVVELIVEETHPTLFEKRSEDQSHLFPLILWLHPLHIKSLALYVFDLVLLTYNAHIKNDDKALKKTERKIIIFFIIKHSNIQLMALPSNLENLHKRIRAMSCTPKMQNTHLWGTHRVNLFLLPTIYKI